MATPTVSTYFICVFIAHQDQLHYLLLFFCHFCMTSYIISHCVILCVTLRRDVMQWDNWQAFVQKVGHSFSAAHLLASHGHIPAGFIALGWSTEMTRRTSGDYAHWRVLPVSNRPFVFLVGSFSLLSKLEKFLLMTRVYTNKRITTSFREALIYSR